MSLLRISALFDYIFASKKRVIDIFQFSDNFNLSKL